MGKLEKPLEIKMCQVDQMDKLFATFLAVYEWNDDHKVDYFYLTDA